MLIIVKVAVILTAIVRRFVYSYIDTCTYVHLFIIHIYTYKIYTCLTCIHLYLVLSFVVSPAAVFTVFCCPFLRFLFSFLCLSVFFGVPKKPANFVFIYALFFWRLMLFERRALALWFSLFFFFFLFLALFFFLAFSFSISLLCVRRGMGKKLYKFIYIFNKYRMIHKRSSLFNFPLLLLKLNMVKQQRRKATNAKLKTTQTKRVHCEKLMYIIRSYEGK